MIQASRILEEVERDGYTAYHWQQIAAALTRNLQEAGFDLRVEPSLEEAKELLVTAVRRAKRRSRRLPKVDLILIRTHWESCG